MNCYPKSRGKCANIAPSKVITPPTPLPRPEASFPPHSSPSLPDEQRPFSLTQPSFLDVPARPLSTSHEVSSSGPPSPHTRASCLLPSFHHASIHMPSTPLLQPPSPRESPFLQQGPTQPNDELLTSSTPRQRQDSTSHQIPSGLPIKKWCIVEGCPAQIAPSMWNNHMSLHAKGVLSGGLPSLWLRDYNLPICHSCFQLVSNSRHASHLRRCPQRCITSTPLSTILPSTNPQSHASQDLPRCVN